MKCLVVDDDPLVCETVESFLSRIEGIEFCLKAADGMTAYQLLSSGGVDAAFIDLQMPGLDGPSLLKALPSALPVVVITADASFAARSYEFNVADYLVKPLEFPRFCQAVSRLKARVAAAASAAAPEEIFVKDGSRIVRIRLSRLLYLKAESNYVEFVTDQGSHLSLISMKKLEEILPAHFVRVHRSYMVNRQHVSRVEEGLVMVGTHRIPIGQSYREQFLQQLKVIN